MPQVAVPLGFRQLVADQPVGGGAVGNPQQRLGQTHQDDAFPGTQPVFMQETVKSTVLLVALAHRRHQLARCGFNPRTRGIVQPRRLQQRRQRLRFIHAISGRHRAAMRVIAKGRWLRVRNAEDHSIRHPQHPYEIVYLLQITRKLDVYLAILRRLTIFNLAK